MRFTEMKLDGVYIIKMDPFEDERGFFARSFCAREFADRGLNPKVMQCSISCNRKRGTLRGMHYQVAPHAEAKLVSCIQGSIYDVVIDLRPGSRTFKQWNSVELIADYRTVLYIPEGFAHGFQTLEDSTVVSYQISEFYHPESSHGVRLDDPQFDLKWPIDEPVISCKDRSYPDFR